MMSRSISGRHSSSTVVGLATLFGTLLALYGPLRPHLQIFVALTLTSTLALLLPLVLRVFFGHALQHSRGVLLTLGVTSIAALVTLLVALDQLAQRWSPADEGARIIADVVVDSLSERRGLALEFDALAQVESPQRLQRELRLRITWREPPAALPRAGERWRLLLQVSAPRANSNPGGFDEQREFFRDRLQGRATVLPSTLNERLAMAPGGLLGLRERLAFAVREAVVDRDAAALFAGLAVGATGEVSREQWQTFSVTGTTHLVAISGMHVTLFCWLVAACARALWRRSRRLAQLVDREIFAASLGVPAACGYALLAGFGIPTQRTVVMLAVWWGLRLSGRVHAPFDALGVALVVVLCIDPFAALSSGFWLSFIAMAALILVDVKRVEDSSIAARSWRQSVVTWLRDNLRTQWWISLALLPITLLWFASVSVAGLIVNLVAIPVFSFVLVPVALGGSAIGLWSASAARPIWWLGERVHEVLWPALVAVASQPWAAVAWSPLASLPWLGVERPAFGEVMVTALEAGNGAAFIVRTRAHALVYDTGEHFDSDGRAAERLVLPALRSFGLKKIDLLLLSRTHAYRAAGAARLMQGASVAGVSGGGEWPGAARALEDCTVRREWTWDGVAFSRFGERNGSCVLRIGFKNGSAVLTSPTVLIPERIDAQEAAALARRARRGELELTATVVIAPRGGSPAAVTPDFVVAVDPQWVLLGGREGSATRRQRVASVWQIPVERVYALADQGAVTLHLRAGLPPRWLGHADLQGAPLWRYDPRH